MKSPNSTKEKVIDLNRPHVCEFCHKTFVHEHTLLAHACESKRRQQSQHLPYVKQAFVAYKIIWHQLHPRQINVIPTYQEFCSSSMWPTLVRFACWCDEQLVQEYENFVRYLLHENVKGVAWCDRRLYEAFLKDLLLTESPEQALSRSLNCVHMWHENSQKPYSEFFSSVNTNQLVSWVKQGRISPWLLYNCVSAEKFFVRCNPEQLNMIQETYPVTIWKVKFLRLTNDTNDIKFTLQEAGM